jgi:hypothetical protein
MAATDLIPTTFGDKLPGFVCGLAGAPGIVVVQVRHPVAREIDHHTRLTSGCNPLTEPSYVGPRSGGA